MKLNRRLLVIITICLCFCFTACEENEEIAESKDTTILSTQTETEQLTTVQPTTENDTLELSNTYITKLRNINGVAYPAFTFNYPDNWAVTDEEVGTDYESVTLENKSGSIIWFSHISGEKGKNIGGGSRINMARIEVSEIADSQFVPDAANKNLGEFMVAGLKTTGVLDMRTDSDYKDVEMDFSYAVLPKSEVGLREGVTKAISGEFTFYYGANISFVGSNTDDDFTEEEQQEVISILNTFRLK